MNSQVRGINSGKALIARLKELMMAQEGIVLGLAILMFVAFSTLLPGFLTAGNLIALVRSVSILGILALGMCVAVIGRGIDISMVATMVISVASALAITQSGVSLAAALAFGLLLAFTIGLAIGLLTAYAEVPPIFTTLAAASIVYGMGRSLFLSLETQNVPPGNAWFEELGRSTVAGLPAPIIAFSATALLVHLLLRYTRLGRFVYALGDNPLSSRITGVPNRPVIVVQYCISASVAFIAGLVMAASIGSMNTRVYNSTMIYDVLLVVVIGGVGLSGGRGGVRNVLVGTLLVGLMLNGMTILNITYTVQNLIKSSVLLLALVLDTFVNPRDEQTAQQGDI